MPRKRVDPDQHSERAVQAFQLRMQRPLKNAVDQAAARNSRSINAEINARLEASFREQERFGGPALEPIIQRIVAAFLHGARIGCLSQNHPELDGDADRWLQDQMIRRVAIAAAIDELQAIERTEATR